MRKIEFILFGFIYLFLVLVSLGIIYTLLTSGRVLLLPIFGPIIGLCLTFITGLISTSVILYNSKKRVFSANIMSILYGISLGTFVVIVSSFGFWPALIFQMISAQIYFIDFFGLFTMMFNQIGYTIFYENNIVFITTGGMILFCLGVIVSNIFKTRTT